MFRQHALGGRVRFWVGLVSATPKSNLFPGYHPGHVVVPCPLAQAVPKGAFSHSRHSVHSANYCAVYPGTPLENHPPTEACMINSKQPGVQNSGPWDPWQASKLKKNPRCTTRGCRVQNSGPWDPWLLVVENNRLFAQRGHSARCAPKSTENDGFAGYR